MTGADLHKAERVLGESYFDFEMTRIRIEHHITTEFPPYRDTLAGTYGWHITHRSRRSSCSGMEIEEE